MKNIYKKTAAIFIIGILAIAMPLEILGIVNNQTLFKNEAESKLQYAVKNSAEEMNIIFNGMDNLLNMMQATARAEFSGDVYRTDISQYEQAKEKFGKILKDTLKETSYISGLYLTFNPEIYKNRQEIWFAYNEKEEIEQIDSSPVEVTPVWLPDDSAYEPDYYYDAISDGDFWVGMDYDNTLNVYMATHTRPVYDKNEELIGIVGTDIYMDNIKKIIEGMPLYDDSEVFLLGSDLQFYVSSWKGKNPEDHFRRQIDGIRKSGKAEGSFWYKSKDNDKNIAAYSTLDNGWVVASSQPADSVMTAATETRDSLILTMILTLLAIIVLVFILIRKTYVPVVETAQQNEIIAINRSRQAKLGEMIGNIAHQCKQPLNSMNIDISNMEDDFNANELTEKTFKQYAEKLRGSIKNMSATITGFADFLKPDRERVVFSVAEEIEKTLSILDESLRINRVDVEKHLDEDVLINGFPNEFSQCIFNVVENARDATISSNGTTNKIIITLSSTETEKSKIVRVEIFNTGDTIQEGSNLFEPYYTTKAKQGGTGLGLYLTKQIIEDHFGGKISCENTSGGVNFIIDISEK